jgi:hypothetical protein
MFLDCFACAYGALAMMGEGVCGALAMTGWDGGIV